MVEAIEKIRGELLIAQAQLAAARKAKAGASGLGNVELIALIERVEYFRGRVDMAALLMAKIGRGMRQDAAEEAWRRAYATSA